MTPLVWMPSTPNIGEWNLVWREIMKEHEKLKKLLAEKELENSLLSDALNKIW